ncbi:MAG: helix-turn-helix domain-containing protein, partial [Desulfobacterales bacterium]
MQTVGSYLRQEREAKNISLGEVAQLTKISEFYLDFLEKDDYEKLPQGPYIKGYISSYARLIGSNADEAIKLYNSLQEQMSQIEAAQTERSEVDAIPAPIASLQEKIGTPFKELSASFKAKTASLKIDTLSSESQVVPFKKFSAFFKTAGTGFKAVIPSSEAVAASLKTAGVSITKVGLSILRASSSLKKIAPFLKRAGGTLGIHRWLFNRRTWLSACLLSASAGILILAGFGFYHLFIFQKNPTPAAKMQPLQYAGTKTMHAAPSVKAAEPVQTQPAVKPSDQLVQEAGTKTMHAAASAKAAEPAQTQPAVKPSGQLVEIKKNEVLPPLIEVPAGLKTLSAPVDPAAGVSRDTLASENTSVFSRSASGKSVPNSKTELPASKTASSKATTGKDKTAESRQKPAPAPSPKPTSTLANLSVSEAIICENVKGRMPAGVQNSFPSSIPRVYVWSLIKAEKYPSKIRHIYYFGDQKISDVALNVRSYSWRTWSYQ